MRTANMGETITADRLLDACRLLFGTEVEPSLDFLKYLQESGIKSAYRKKARETHPDRASILNCDVKYLENQFKLVNDAYRYLLSYVQNPARFIIIGKTIPRRPERPAPLRENRIPFGRYLYYRGFITYRNLIEALLWQKKKRPPLGELAKRMRLLKDGEVREILRRRRPGEMFGESALRLGFLSPGELERLLQRQRLIQPRIGRYFIEKGILSLSEVERLAWEFRLANQKRNRIFGFG